MPRGKINCRIKIFESTLYYKLESHNLCPIGQNVQHAQLTDWLVRYYFPILKIGGLKNSFNHHLNKKKVWLCLNRASKKIISWKVIKNQKEYVFNRFQISCYGLTVSVEKKNLQLAGNQHFPKFLCSPNP